MDAYHFAGAAGGLLLGIWLKTGNREPDVRPCICHCAVSSPERSTGEGAWLWLVCFGLVGLLVTNLALAFRVSFRKDEAGLQEFTFSVKGKSGKGVYGVPKGLQITEQ